MPIIKSISGIRGTIGGLPNDNLTPPDILKFACAYGQFIKTSQNIDKVKVIIGRDSRVSGESVRSIVVGALLSLGIDVIDLGMASTPTVAMAVMSQEAHGGIIISASHNPQGWNALKLLNCDGEYLSAKDGLKVLAFAEENGYAFVNEENSGAYIFNPYLEWDHIHKIEKLPLVEKDLIKSKDFKIVVDGINSIGAKAISHVLEMLGVSRQIIINGSLDGRFAHNPEPLEKNLGEIMERVKSEGADLGIVVDPDVDRLAFIDENGKMFGEEYSLVAISNYVLENFSILEKLYPGKYKLAAVSNLSSSRALKDVVSGYGGEYEASAVGEVNVVTKMKEIKAVIGGEGNGGIIFPELHYGRDALLGVALFLSYLAKTYKKVSEIRKNLPSYFMVKDRLVLKDGFNLNTIINKLKEEYKLEKISTIDGIKIDFKDSWAHLRASNTEPILRIYTEAKTKQEAQDLNNKIKEKVLIFIQ